MDEKLTQSLEDYLEALYNILEKNKTVKAVEVSRLLNVSRASVTEALKKLGEKELISYAKYDTISLTVKGIKLAREITKKHKLLSDFIENVLGASKVEAQNNACKIEHVISKDVLKRINAFTKYCKKNIKDDFKKTYKS